MRPLPRPLVEQAFDAALADECPALESPKVRVRLLELDSLVTLIPQASAARLSFARELVREYEAAGLAPFEPVLSEMGDVHLCPLVEVSTEGNLILDGMHRCMASWASGQRWVAAAAIKCRSAPPFAGPCCSLAEVEVLPAGVEPPAFYWGKGNKNFRPGLQVVHNAIRRVERSCGGHESRVNI